MSAVRITRAFARKYSAREGAQFAPTKFDSKRAHAAVNQKGRGGGGGATQFAPVLHQYYVFGTLPSIGVTATSGVSVTRAGPLSKF